MGFEVENLLTDLNYLEIEDQESVGIEATFPHMESPECGWSNKKRSHKSFQELRIRDGETRGQSKLTDLFYFEKEMILPSEP